MPICPTCGAVLKKGVDTCSCGTTIIMSDDEELEHLLVVEAQKVEKFQDLKAKCLQAFDDGNFEESLNYSSEALDLGIGSDAELSFSRGKSLFYMNRFLDSARCFDDYIMEYKDSFYRFSNISGAYEWKAKALWQLGDGFGSIKCYYKALDYVDRNPCSNQEKMDMRLHLEESKREVMHASNGEGLANPILGDIDENVYDKLEGFDPDIHVTMQRLYDAIDEVASDGFEFRTLMLKGNDVYVEFARGDETVEKLFDGSSSFKL